MDDSKQFTSMSQGGGFAMQNSYSYPPQSQNPYAYPGFSSGYNHAAPPVVYDAAFQANQAYQQYYSTAYQSTYSLSVQYNNACAQPVDRFSPGPRKPKMPRFAKKPESRTFSFDNKAESRKQYRCELCNIFTTEEPALNAHLIGKKHLHTEKTLKEIDAKLKVEAFQVREKINKGIATSEESLELRCNVCSQSLPGIALYKTHLTGYNHKNSVSDLKSQGLDSFNVLPDFVTPVSEDIKNNVLNQIRDFLQGSTPVEEGPESEYLQTQKRLYVRQNDDDSKKFVCILCKTSLPSDPKGHELHLLGKQHRKNSERSNLNSDAEKSAESSQDFTDCPINTSFEESLSYSEDIDVFRFRQNYEADLTHYSVDPDPMIPFETFLENSNVPRPLTEKQLYQMNLHNYFNYIPEDALIESRSRQISPSRTIITDLYNRIKLVSHKTYEITYAINQCLLDLGPYDREELRLKKCQETAQNKILDRIFLEILDKLPQKVNCFHSTAVRTGAMAKGVALNDEELIELVVVCKFFPTKEVLRLFELGYSVILPKVETSGYTVQVIRVEEEASIRVIYFKSQNVPFIEIVLQFTSAMMRSQPAAVLDEIPNLLDREICLKALAEVRRQRWFKEKHVYYPYFAMIIRILRDFQNRNPLWHLLSCYQIELILDHILRCSEILPSPAVLIRNFFKFISQTHLSTQKYFGDVCEQDYPNPFANLTEEQSHQLSQSASTFLELILNQKMPLVLFKKSNNHSEKEASSLALCSDSHTGDCDEDNREDVRIINIYEDGSNVVVIDN